MKKITLFIFLITALIGNSQSIEGTWKLSPQALALAVGPAQGSAQWWSNNVADLTSRACLFDDEFVFNANGTFSNVMGATTWVENWQDGAGDTCRTPVAPHNGSNAATYTYNAGSGTLTLNGLGAFLGLAKAYNGGELAAPSGAPTSITYLVTSLTANLLTLDIAVGGGNWWRFIFQKQGVLPTCTDGIQNGGETGIDCGGTCANPCTNRIDLPVTFEGTTTDFTMTNFGDTVSTKVVDPTDAMNQVMKVVKQTSSPLWAGTTISTPLGFANPVPISVTSKKMSVRVWSPDAGVPVRFKIEDPNDPTHSCEAQINTTVAAAWETLVFDFAVQAAGTAPLNLSYNFQMASIFFNFGTDGATAGEKTYYFDDVKMATTTTVMTTPMTPAPTPTRPAANVISMFSNPYTNVGVDTWQTGWSPGVTVSDLQIVGNDTKKYTNLDYVGIETTGANIINATSMLYFHIDVWTPNMTTFRVKLVDYGADGVNGGGDDKEHELSFTPTLSGWNSYDIALSDFTSLTSRAHLAQLILSGLPAGTGIVYIDNVYFHNVPMVDPNTPMVAAPVPTRPAASVVSMFSNTYTDVNVDTWKTFWSPGVILTDLQVAGNDTKKYTNLDYVGIETATTTIDITGMTHFHLDAWTPNMTVFKIKLVDFGANNAPGGGDDKESEVIKTPTLSGWNSYDIPMSDFAGLTTKAHFAQLILSGTPVGAGIVFVDNVYFANDNYLATNAFETTTVSMYPNPANNVLNISANSNIETVTIFSLLGQEVASKVINNSSTILDISNLQTGVYIVKTSINGNVSSTRLIKK